MMGFGSALLLICGFVFFGIFGGLKAFRHFYPEKYVHQQGIVDGCFLYGGLLGGGLILSLLSFLPISFCGFWMLMGLGILGIEKSSFPCKWKALLSFLLCWGAVLNLYFPFEPAFLSGLFVAFCIWFGWQVFVIFDRYAFTSLLVSLCWAIAVVGIHFILPGIVPMKWMIAACLLGICVMALMYSGLSEKSAVLGRMPALFCGFMWACFWGYFLTKGAVVQTTIAWGYYLFEATVLCTAYLTHKPLQTFWGRLAQDPKFASKAMRVVFSHLLILSFLSVMSLGIQAPNLILIFVLLIVLMDLYLRLTAIEKPQPTWKELLKETKSGMTCLLHEWQKKAPSVKQDSPIEAASRVPKRKKRKSKR